MDHGDVLFKKSIDAFMLVSWSYILVFIHEKRDA